MERTRARGECLCAAFQGALRREGNEAETDLVGVEACEKADALPTLASMKPMATMIS